MAGVFTFEFKINEKKKRWTNRNVYNQQKVQPPRRGYESAQGYGNHTTYPIILVMSILEHVAQSQLCDLPNIVDKGRSTRKGKKIVS